VIKGCGDTTEINSVKINGKDDIWNDYIYWLLMTLVSLVRIIRTHSSRQFNAGISGTEMIVVTVIKMM
jgi:hypothetical protein